MDFLSDVFSRLRLRGDFYFTTDFAGGWGVHIPPESRAIRFHLVVEGQCWVEVDRVDEPVHLREGEFVLIPHGAGQRLLSAPDAPSLALGEIGQRDDPGPDGVFRHRGEGPGADCRLVCGFCQFDHDVGHPLFHGLPSMIVLNRQTIGQLPWLADAIRLTTIEANRRGQGLRAIISRLIEILFIQAIRAHTDSSAGIGNPFVRAIDDPQLASALKAIHGEPDRSWTLTSLARAARMSRTRFARRFKDTLGQTPMQYLTDWRLSTARQLLRDSELSIADIAFRSGYRSVPSFTRRFKERFGITPAAYRRAGIVTG
jgi:AraC family transcriptional regulator, alkane utilization regulator